MMFNQYSFTMKHKVTNATFITVALRKCNSAKISDILLTLWKIEQVTA